MSKLPAIQLYIGDWLKDPKLSMCSPSTRGIWMDLLCAMHELDRSGQVTGTTEQLARACRCTASEMSAAIAELGETKTANISEREGKITVINRRMLAEFQERESAKLRKRNQRKSDDVTLCPQNVQSSETDENKRHKGVSRESHKNVTSYSSSSSSISSSKSSAATESTRAREPAAVADFSERKNGNGHRSKFDEAVCREFVDAVRVPAGNVNNPGGLAHSIYVSGASDPDIQNWLNNGKQAEKPKRKAVIPG